jgi:hypothetical protein
MRLTSRGGPLFCWLIERLMGGVREAGTDVVVKILSADPDKMADILAGFPQLLIKRLAAAPKGQALNKGIEGDGHMIKRIKEEKICDEVHIMAIGRKRESPRNQGSGRFDFDRNGSNLNY